MNENDDGVPCPVCDDGYPCNCYDGGVKDEHTRIVEIIQRRRIAYENQDDGHGALLAVGLGMLQTEIESGKYPNDNDPED